MCEFQTGIGACIRYQEIELPFPFRVTVRGVPALLSALLPVLIPVLSKF